jgi:hypothetical protein
MPKVADYILADKAGHIECERLFLPSCLPTNDRQLINAIELGVEEGKLREGAAFDALRATQTAVKHLVTLQNHKTKHSRGQAQNTRSRRFIADAEARRNLHIKEYNDHRTAMIALGIIEENGTNSQFPLLEIKDTFMKSTYESRQLGDSRRIDGRLWSFPKCDMLPSQGNVSIVNGSNNLQCEGEVGTQMCRRKKGMIMNLLT